MSWKSIKNYWSDWEAHKEALTIFAYTLSAVAAGALLVALAFLASGFPWLGIPALLVYVLGGTYALIYNGPRR